MGAADGRRAPGGDNAQRTALGDLSRAWAGPGAVAETPAWDTAVDDVVVPVAQAGPSVRRVLVVEDQPDQAEWLISAIRRLRPQWQIDGPVPRADALLNAIDEQLPQALFLDVHLADGTIMEALKSLPYPVPIVFTSGDPSFALEAYEHAALDYLLKPVRASRLARALARIEAASGGTAAQRQGGEPGWIMARRGDGAVIIRLADILYLQAQAKFTRIVTHDGDAMLRRGLGLVERQLDARHFHRIHRGTVINIDHAGSLIRDDLGRMKLQMRGRSEWLYISKPFEGLFKST